MLCLILQQMGHDQPPIPIHYDNKTALNIENDIMEKCKYWLMEIVWFWIEFQVKRAILDVLWHPGTEKLAVYLP